MEVVDECEKARQRIDVYRTRYREFGEGYFPLQIAVQWERALIADPIDARVLASVVANATARREDFDVAFFTFCNHMEGIINQG